MNLNFFHQVLAGQNGRGYDLNQNQRNAVEYDGAPLWIIAGPGSGKTEVLVTRTLRLLCVGNQIDPRSMLITTFTKKAARNMEDRLASYLSVLQAAEPSLNSVDLADLRIGTIHSLCNDILLEYRAPAYQNVRLLDDVDQHLFVHRYAAIVGEQDLGFWSTFEYAVSYWSRNSSRPPNKWQRAKTAVNLFNHIVEDLVDIDLMRARGGSWAQLANYYVQYRDALQQRYRCDFAHLQLRFLDFLNTQAGQRFLDGDGSNHLPLKQVLVDEYQDTNPIQERIYLALAQRSPHNLTVVGDDDQALYRFRGGTVACMVNFDQACQTAFSVQPYQIPLLDNYRSHNSIVTYFNDYITSHPEMLDPGVRAPGKQNVTASSSISGTYPAVSWISRQRTGDLASAVANLVEGHLIRDGIIQDLSQCVILFRSTKDSPQNAGPYLAEFARRNIPVYNPRSKSFMESVEVQCLLAALINTVDLDGIWAGNLMRELTPTVQGWVNTLRAIFNDPSYNTTALLNYIQNSNRELRRLCQTNPGSFLGVSLHEILFRIISLEPFRTWRQNPERNLRLSKVTRLIESYHSMNLDALRADPGGNALAPNFLEQFYYMFIGYLIDTGIDDDEDEEVVVPQGSLPFMTIHQSKGLEFPFVIVTQMGNSPRTGAAQILENELAPFRRDLYPRTTRTPDVLAVEDDIRLMYVAYSRAEYGLIMVGTPGQLRDSVTIPSRDFTNFRRTIPVI